MELQRTPHGDYVIVAFGTTKAEVRHAHIYNAEDLLNTFRFLNTVNNLIPLATIAHDEAEHKLVIHGDITPEDLPF